MDLSMESMENREEFCTVFPKQEVVYQIECEPVVESYDFYQPTNTEGTCSVEGYGAHLVLPYDLFMRWNTAKTNSGFSDDVTFLTYLLDWHALSRKDKPPGTRKVGRPRLTPKVDAPPIEPRQKRKYVKKIWTQVEHYDRIPSSEQKGVQEESRVDVEHKFSPDDGEAQDTEVKDEPPIPPLHFRVRKSVTKKDVKRAKAKRTRKTLKNAANIERPKRKYVKKKDRVAETPSPDDTRPDDVIPETDPITDQVVQSIVKIANNVKVKKMKKMPKVYIKRRSADKPYTEHPDDKYPRRRYTELRACPFCCRHLEGSQEDNNEHLTSHLDRLAEGNARCIFCEESLKDLDEGGKLEHAWSHAVPAFRCVECSKVLTKTFFNNHNCTEEMYYELKNEGSDFSPFLLHGNTRFLCLECGKKSGAGIKRLLLHITIQHNRVKLDAFRCAYCVRYFWRKVQLQQHEFHVHKVGHHWCKHCKRYIKHESFHKHKKMHKPKKPCDICGKLYATNQINRHKMTHLIIKPYQCDYCEKTFTQKSNRDQHQRLHTGEIQHECEYCGKRFVQSANYIQHLRVHTNVKASELKGYGDEVQFEDIKVDDDGVKRKLWRL